jgi:prepilin-type N-terminal cleavage/methylation domain-containing protein
MMLERKRPRRPRAAALRRRALGRRFRAGYTAVEVLMAMAVLAVGVVGIIATEKITLASNVHSKNLAIATHVAEAWLGMLDAEAALWNTSATPFGRTIWLAQGAGLSTWFRPNDDATLNFGPAFNALGNPVRTVDQDPNARFCADLRLSPLTTSNTGGGLMRAEVRVIWLRNENAIGSATASNACSIAAVSVEGANESRLFHFVYMSGAVRQVGQ